MAQRGLPRAQVRLLSTVAVAGAVATIFAAWAASQSTVLRNPDLEEAWRPAFVATYAAAGLYLWQLRPSTLSGRRIAGLALLYAVTSLNAFSDPWLFSAGRVAVALFVAGMVYVFLSYPGDRLPDRDRIPVAILTAALVAVWALTLLCSSTYPPSGPLSACREPCPSNPARVFDSTALGDAGRAGVTVVTSLLLLVLVAGLFRKLRSPGPFRRYLFGPPLVGVAGLAVSYAAYTLLVARGGEHPWPLALATILFGIAVPVSLVGGQLWAVSTATGRLRRFVLDLPPSQISQERLQETLRGTLDDRTLRFWRWSRSRAAFVDASGATLELHDRRADGETVVEPEGRPAAALTHDPALQDLAPVPEALAGTAVMLLDDASLREELRTARQRLAATSHTERVRLERDLHDGIQPRLTALAVKLAEAQALSGSPELAALLADAERVVTELVADVRSLAHELYPPGLHEQGLASALQAAVHRRAVKVTDRGIGSLTPAVEEALYYVTLEAVQNAMRHGGSGALITVMLERDGDDAVVRIEDDGVGFDVIAVRSGLGTMNMRDRAGAVGGEVSVDSHPGDGATVTLRVPLTGPAPDGDARQRMVGQLLEVAERNRAAAAAHQRAAEFWEEHGDDHRVADERSAAAAALVRARQARSSARAVAGRVSPGVDEDGTLPVP
jgi:signal transduction histidine kinase